MIKSLLYRFFGISKNVEASRNTSVNFEKEYDLIEDCKETVRERIEFYNQLKEIYNPSKDKQGSYTWNFMHNRQYMELRKVSLGYIKEYQQKYNITLPNLLIRVLTEIGSGGYINTNLINHEKKIDAPYVCMEKEFLNKCLDARIDPKLIEDGINEFYDFENNSFTHSGIQKVYKSLESNRDKHLAILFGMGHDVSIVLNREDNTKLVTSGIPGITNLSFQVNSTEYDSPYFKYEEGTLNEAICPINEHWWKKMKEDILNMNKE